MSIIFPIKDLTNAQIEKFDKELTFTEEDKDKWNKFSKNKPQKKLESIKMYMIDVIDGVTHIRLPFYYMTQLYKQLLNRHKIFPTVNYKFAIPLLPRQIPVVEEAYTQLYTYGTTQLSIPTGFGKSFMSVYLASKTQCYIAVILTIQALTDSWVSTFETAFPDLKDRIWVVGDRPQPSDPCIFIFMHGRYEKIPREMRSKIGCMIIDESHLHCTASRIPALLCLEPKYVIGLSATPERDDGMEKIIQSITGSHMVERLSENPYTIVKLKTNIRIAEERNKFGGIDYSKLVNNQAEIVERNVMCINIVNGLAHRKFMILVKTKEHVEALTEMFKHYGIICDSLYGTKKKYTESRVLIGTISKISTGFDESTKVDNFSGYKIDTVILMTTLKKHTVLKQAFGRVVGRAENPYIIYFVDENPVCKRHFTECKDLAKRTQGKILEVEYDPDVMGGGVKI